MKSGTDARSLIAAVERAGYRASHPSIGGPAGGKAEPSHLAGRWLGRLAVGEGRTSELVVDLDVVSGHWVGQFDLREFGVEDYPVDVAVDSPKVTLHLTAARIEFEGVLSRDGRQLAGIALTQGHRDSLALARVGEARFSKDFLALEEISNDSALLTRLGADAAELRQTFNDDRSHTRLLMLLSPT